MEGEPGPEAACAGFVQCVCAARDLLMTLSVYGMPALLVRVWEGSAGWHARPKVQPTQLRHCPVLRASLPLHKCELSILNHPRRPTSTLRLGRATARARASCTSACCSAHATSRWVWKLLAVDL